MGKAIAYTMILLQVAAAIGYAAGGDYKRAAYWFFAACITVVVTW